MWEQCLVMLTAWQGEAAENGERMMVLHPLNLYGKWMPLIAGFTIMWDNSLQSLYKAGKVGTIWWIVLLCSNLFLFQWRCSWNFREHKWSTQAGWPVPESLAWAVGSGLLGNSPLDILRCEVFISTGKNRNLQLLNNHYYMFQWNL